MDAFAVSVGGYVMCYIILQELSNITEICVKNYSNVKRYLSNKVIVMTQILSNILFLQVTKM